MKRPSQDARRTARYFSCIAIAVFGLAPIAALAQTFDPKSPATFVVGAPNGPTSTDRFDARRSGDSRVPLPTGRLKTLWHHTFGASVEHEPLVVGSDIVLVAGRGDVAFLDVTDGSELARVSIGAGSSGPPTALADGTIVVVASSGVAIGVRKTGVVFRTRVGGEPSILGHISPLSLDDGGVVVATGTELDVLDARGGIRARAALPEEIDGSLLASRGRVLAVADSGVVYAWTPGRDVERIGNFGARVVGGATLADSNTLLAVVEGARLLSLDIDKGVVVPRAVSSGFLFIGPVAMRGSSALMLAKGVRGASVLAFDRAGEMEQTPVTSSPLSVLADGGVAGPTVGGHAPLVVDAAGDVAFSIEDDVGVVAADGTVSRVDGTVCRSRSADVLGLAPIRGAPGDPAFVVACDDGALALIAERR